MKRKDEGIERDVTESLFSKSGISISKYSNFDSQLPMTLLKKNPKNNQLASMVENTLAKYYEGALMFQTMIKQQCQVVCQKVYWLQSFLCLKCFQDITRAYRLQF